MEIREIQRDELPQLLALYRYLHPEGWLEEGPDAQKIWQAIQAAPGYHIVVAEGGRAGFHLYPAHRPQLDPPGPALRSD